MWVDRARNILAMKGAGDIAILAGAVVVAFLLSFALPGQHQAGSATSEQVTVVVAVPPRPDRPAAKTASPPQSPSTSPAPGDAGSLTRLLQSELKRVGCYDGESHGVWSKSTRLAMKAFTERVNARLPVEKPDHILLALLQGHQGQACAVACGEGKMLHADGRCVPEAIVTRVSSKPETPEPVPPKAGDAAIVAPLPVAAVRPRPPAPAVDEARVAPSAKMAKDLPPSARPLPEVARPPEPPTAAATPEREKHAVRDRGPVPEVGMRGARPRNSTRTTSYRQIRYAKSLFRNLKRAANNALPFP